ncbi:putative bifunctional diguanylate cyclase/phosphodiesterase [Roseomonas sp. WA12]
MTIRLKLLLGCLALAAVTVLLGTFNRGAQRELGRIAVSLYDETFLAMSYLRSAQNGLTRAEVAFQASGSIAAAEAAARGTLLGTLPEIADDLNVALERALSPGGREAATRLAAGLAALQAPGGLPSTPEVAASLHDLGTGFDRLVEIYAADGFRQRRSVAQLIETTERHGWMAIAVSLAVALVITAALARSIVPPIRAAVGVARSIAAGQLDNAIATEGRGQSETAQLLHALSAMQASLKALIAAQESSHAGELAGQVARFDAALSNMIQGLCLFGPDGRLAVVNRRFVEMFGAPKLHAPPGEVFPERHLAELLSRHAGDESQTSRDLPDGRTLTVAHRPVEGGGWVATYEDVTDRRRAEAKLAHMAHHDSLTGLPNRTLFHKHVQHLFGGASRGNGAAVLTLDLDRFKAVNDTLGHPAGDTLLRLVSDRLQNCTRSTDLVARLGGDEFAVVQEATGQPDDATALSQRLLAALAEPFLIEGQQVTIGTSIGIALGEEGLNDPDELLKRADLALYRAKGDGRGTWRFFEPEMNVLMQARSKLERDLRRAVQEQKFEVHYQPVIDAEGRKVSGFEALLRWEHPERGMVSPAEFVPMAEEIGLIRPIGAWVLRTACTAAAAWPEALKVAVNLSPAQFTGGSLVAEVADALQGSGLAAHRLELEITESLLLMDDASVLSTLHALRDLGVRIAMDDFGTGYSSLSYLQRFPFDKIKIDQSFVRGLGRDEHCSAIIRAVVGMGRALRITVNAEGVETPEQLVALCAEGCDELQGYLFSHPRPVRDVAAMLLNTHAGSRPPELTTAA